MKLLRYGIAGKELPGLRHADGSIRSLRGRVPDIGLEQISPRGLAAIATIDPATLPAVPSDARLGVPFVGARKFIAAACHGHGRGRARRSHSVDAVGVADVTDSLKSVGKSFARSPSDNVGDNVRQPSLALSASLPM